MAGWIAGYAEAATVAHHWVGGKVRFGLLARGQGRNLAGISSGLETEEALEPAHRFLSFVQLVPDADMLLRAEGLGLSGRSRIFERWVKMWKTRDWKTRKAILLLDLLNNGLDGDVWQDELSSSP